MKRCSVEARGVSGFGLCLSRATEDSSSENLTIEIRLGRDVAKMAIITDLLDMNKILPYEHKVIQISEVMITQNQLLKISTALTPSDKWEVSKIPTDQLFQQGLDSVKRGDFSEAAVFGIIKGTALAGDKYGSAYEGTDNKLLGVQQLKEVRA